jgi:RimJ/RimL family protein N-acetyltransferase
LNVYSDDELIRIHTDLLYIYDANNRLLRINEPEPDNPAPRFFLARSREGNLWRFRHDVPDDLAAELDRLAAAEPVASDFRAPPHHQSQYAALLNRHAPVATTWSGPAYYLAERQPPTHAVTITSENRHLLGAHYAYTLQILADREPVAVIADNGAAVAVCFSARGTNRAAEAGVHTMEAYRGRGYAADTVRAWAAAVRASGRLPLYSTSWDNTASQAVARKLGAVLYGTDFSIG